MRRLIGLILLLALVIGAGWLLLQAQQQAQNAGETTVFEPARSADESVPPPDVAELPPTPPAAAPAPAPAPPAGPDVASAPPEPAPEAPAAQPGTPPPAAETTAPPAAPDTATSEEPPATPPAANAVPTFDVVRVEPSGDTVIAGLAAPEAKVEVLDGAEAVATAEANERGEWALVLDKPLPPGTHDLAIRTTSSDKSVVTLSDQRVGVAVTPGEEPLVVLNAPKAPSKVMQVPAEPEIAAAPETPPPAEPPASATAPQPTPPAPATPPEPGAPPAASETDIASAPPAEEPPPRPAAPTTPAPSDPPIASAPAPTEPAPSEKPMASAPPEMPQAPEATPPAATETPPSSETAKTAEPAPSAEEPAPSTGPSPQPEIAAAPPQAEPPPPSAAKPAPSTGEPAPSTAPAPQQPEIAAAPPQAEAPAPIAPEASPPAPAEPPVAQIPKPPVVEAPKPPEPKVGVAAVEAETNGALYIAGTATSSEPVRVYVDDELVGEATPTEGGTWLIETNRELPPGEYKIRADQVDEGSGKVIVRAEVPFEREIDVAVLKQSNESADPGGAEVSGSVAGPMSVIIKRGDNLWRISREMYGHGVRFSTIYRANKDQIRNPNRIYPGQVFVLPQGDTAWQN